MRDEEDRKRTNTFPKREQRSENEGERRETLSRYEERRKRARK